MRVFVTGATGFVGSAVVRDLLDAGHEVVGLARSEAGAAAVAAAGAAVHRGDLNDLDGLRRGAAEADGVIHTAFNHDFSRFQASCEEDRRIVGALAEALGGSGRPLIVTSGIGILPPAGLATEDRVAVAGAGATPRVASEEAAAAAAARGLRASVMRLPPTVHGDDDHGFVPLLIDLARRTGVVVTVDDGANRWSAVHRLDAARLYRLAIESAAAEPRWHAVAEEGIPFREIAAVIGRRLGLPVVAKSGQEAAAHFGWFAHFAGLDMAASSARTRDLLGWRPTGPGLLADLDRPAYFGD